MINKNDELLHLYEKSPGWEESYKINFADKKTKIYGCIDINYFFGKKSVAYRWIIIKGKNEYSFEDETEFDGNLKQKNFNYKGLKYKILDNGYKNEILLKNSEIEVTLKLNAIFQAYNYPAAACKEIDEKREYFESILWKRYEQRYTVKGIIKYKKGEKKGSTDKVDCYALKEHLWGERLLKDLKVYSSYYIQFRDMSISLSYLNFNGVIVPNGFISLKSGNIPINEVEMEHIDLNPKNNLPQTTEISYLDSEDDRDLIVANKFFPVSMPDKVYSRRKFCHFRNFSEFTIIGANKKGVGMEEHFILQNSLNEYVRDK